MTTSLAPLAVVHELQDLIEAMRRRVDELNVSREEIDLVVGLGKGHAEKLLRWPQGRGFGMRTLGPMMAVLGMALIAVEDPEARARWSARMKQRKAYQVRTAKRLGVEEEIRIRAEEIAASLARTNGAKGGKARMKAMTPDELKLFQARAARIGWTIRRRTRRLSAMETTP